MEFRILGPLEVLEDGHPLPIGGHKQRALLVCLLLEANRVVSRDRLLEVLWEGEPPETGGKALQVYVSQLRKLLGRERVETQAPGYRLRLEEGELDLERFQRLRAQGKFAQALALWRGPPLAELAYRRFAQAEIARLEELRLTCLEERIDQDLAQGRHGELVGELEALVREHPLRERLRSRLMLCLYRSGRQAEALEAYQEARRALTEDLGIEPSKELRELQQAILRQDPALETVTEPPEPREQGRGVFVGRERELEQLRQALDDALAGQGRLVLVSGEPGIGKSRLVDELIQAARERHARVLVGRCWEAGGAPPYWPWVQALRTLVEEAEAEQLRAQLGAGAVDLAQLLPELRELFPDLPEPPPLESAGARFRLFEAASSFLRSASRARPLVLALDDLHAADEPSLLLLQFLARQLDDRALLVAAAYRDVDPTLHDPLAATLAELAREPVTRRISLGGLEEDDVRAFIELSTATKPPGDLVAAIYEETEGNPLFVGEIVRLLAAEGRLDPSGRWQLFIPQSVREVIGARIRRLPEECRGVLVIASILGRELAVDALARASERPVDGLLAVLDHAIEERVIGEVPGAPGRLRFAHALIRDAIYEELPAARRLRLHRHIGEVLEELYASDPEPHLAELAHHFFAAATAGGVEKALDYARRAADRAAKVLAHEEAVRLYELALTASALKGSSPETRCALLLALGDVQARAGDMATAKETFLQAADIARELEAVELLARAALGYGGRFSFARAGTDPRLVPLLEEALAAVGQQESTVRARIAARLAGARRGEASREACASLAREAIDLARRIGDPATLGYVIEAATIALWDTDAQERLRTGAELLSIAARTNDRERAVMGHVRRFGSFVELGEMASADAELAKMAAAAEELRQPAQMLLVLVCRGMRALLVGKLEEAEQLIGEAFQLGERAESWGIVYSRLQLYLLRREQGRLDELEEVIRSSVDEYPNYPVWRCVLSHFYAEQGRPDQAHELLDALAEHGFISFPRDEEWTFSMCLLAEVCVALGDARHAQTLYSLLLPRAGSIVYGVPEVSTGAVDRYLGLLAAAGGRFDDAERHFEQALAINERIGARPWLAHTQEDYGRMLLERDAPGDAGKASRLLEQALASYRELGMAAYAAKASALAAAAGG